MSLPFNSTSTQGGIVQLYEREIGVQPGYISGNDTFLKQFVADANLSLDEFFAIAFQADGTWQFDDNRHSKMPIITTELTQGKRIYPFTKDGQDNLILEIHDVFVKTDSGLYQRMDYIDVESDVTNETINYWDGQDTQGVPWRYAKLGNNILLDPIPSYTESKGVKIYIAREGVYFTTTMGSTKPGVPGIFHEYFVIAPAYRYAERKDKSNVNRLFERKQAMEESIRTHFAFREGDKRNVLTNKPFLYR